MFEVNPITPSYLLYVLVKKKKSNLEMNQFNQTNRFRYITVYSVFYIIVLYDFETIR